MDARQTEKREKSRETSGNQLPPGSEADYNVFEIRYDLTADGLKAEGKNVLDSRFVLTHKNEPTLEDESLAEHAVTARARLTVPGHGDLDSLEGRLEKDAPNLPQKALVVILQLSADKKWRIQHGDIESMVLYGAYFEREMYVRAPRGGLPATDITPEISAGTILKLTKAMPGLADAPLEWHKEHKVGRVETNFAKSYVAKTLYLCACTEPHGEPVLEGVLGSHVDDDIMTGSKWFEENIKPVLRQLELGTLVHTGVKIEQDPETRIYVGADRRAQPELPATPDAQPALWAGAGKVAWLVEQPEAYILGLTGFQMSYDQVEAVQTVLDHHTLIDAVKKDAGLEITHASLPLEQIVVIGWCDASSCNMASGRSKESDLCLKSQAEYFLGFMTRDIVKRGARLSSVAAWLSHKLKRNVRSTLAAGAMAGNECRKASDILRAHVHEAIKAGPIDRKTWRAAVKDVQKVLVTDSRSMNDFLHKLGSTPSEKRLRLDLAMIRDEMDDKELIIKRVISSQQLADALTKGSDEAVFYLELVIEIASFMLTKDALLAERIADFKAQQKLPRCEGYRQRRQQKKQSDGPEGPLWRKPTDPALRTMQVDEEGHEEVDLDMEVDHEQNSKTTVPQHAADVERAATICATAAVAAGICWLGDHRLLQRSADRQPGAYLGWQTCCQPTDGTTPPLQAMNPTSPATVRTPSTAMTATSGAAAPSPPTASALPAPVPPAPKAKAKAGAAAPSGGTQNVSLLAATPEEVTRVHVPVPCRRATARKSHAKGHELQFVGRAVSTRGSTQYSTRMTCTPSCAPRVSTALRVGGMLLESKAFRR